MRAVRSYFGFDGAQTRQRWLLAAAYVLPPFVVATVLASLAGVHGVPGWGIWVACAVVAELVWWQLVVLLPPWRHAYKQLKDPSASA